jgi:hypothetical protein
MAAWILWAFATVEVVLGAVDLASLVVGHLGFAVIVESIQMIC